MELFDVTFAGAVMAGLLSFASPCVLPLVPAYLCFLGGVSLDQLTDKAASAPTGSRGVFAAALAFVLGFSTVFVTMGATASALNAVLLDNMRWLTVVAGGVIIAFGLHYMGALRIGFLNFERRVHVAGRPAGLLGAFLVGLAFAFGWTPCVGPVLATILMLAAGSDSVLYGTVLLSAYAAGLGVPFLAAALAARPFMRFLGRFRRHMRAVELAIGGLLIGTGLLILTGKLSAIGNRLLLTFPALGGIG